MVWYGLWHGGSSYSTSADDWTFLERFRSLEAAKTAFWDRATLGGRHRFDFVHQDATSVCTPAVDETATILMFADPEHAPDAAMAVRLIEFGPRLGVRATRI